MSASEYRLGTVASMLEQNLGGDVLAWTSSDNKVKGDQFEKFLLWWLLADPEVQVTHGFIKVALLAEWSENPFRGDVGVDLVAWDRDNCLWAIQAKHYDRSSRIGKDPVAILAGVAKLANQGGPFTGRMVVSTTDDYTENAKAVAREQGVQLLSYSHLAHSADQIQFPASEEELDRWLQGNSPQARPKPTPRKHQRDAVKATLSHLGTNRRGQLLMACGTGKTLAGLWLKEELFPSGYQTGKNGLAVALFPSISLLEQTLREWAVNRSSDWRALAVCSDSTVSHARRGEEEDMKVVDSGLPVSTDKEVIKAFLQQQASERIIFATYQSSHLVAEAALETGKTFDVVFCDEAHRLAGHATKQYSLILEDERFPAHRRVFMTATPRVLTTTAKKRADSTGIDVLSMDDQSKFGEVAFSYSFGQAISDGQLTDYQVVVAVTTDAEALELCNEDSYVEVAGKQMTATDLAAAIAVLKAAKTHNITRCIGFHSTIERSKDFSELVHFLTAKGFSDLPGSATADFVSGGMAAKERRRKLDSLSLDTADFNILSNARCLTEGVDVPTLDAVAFVDPRQSEVDIVQAVGRAVRKADNKKIGTVIVPVVCSSDTGEVELDEAGHRKLRQVLWALRSHDAELAVQIDDFITKNPKGSRGVSRSSLQEKVAVEILDSKLGPLASKINTKVIKVGLEDRNWESWEENYKAAVSSYKETGKWATAFANTQRAAGRKFADGEQVNGMNQMRYDVLDNTPGWYWGDTREEQNEEWYRKLEESKKFYAENGHWPRRNHGLGAFIAECRQRGCRRWQNSKAEYLRERYNVLHELQNWFWTAEEDKWHHNFSNLATCLADDAPEDQEKAASALAWWAEQLEGEGWEARLREKQVSLNLDSQALWEASYRSVAAFCKKENRNPAWAHQGDPEYFIAWVKEQVTRKDWESTSWLKSCKSKLDRLEEIGVWYWADLSAITYSFFESYEQLKLFYEENGFYPTAGSNKKLADFLSLAKINQRKMAAGKEYARGRRTFCESREKLLETLEDWSWEAHRPGVDPSAPIRKFVVELDSGKVGDPFWVAEQRSLWDAGELTSWQYRKLTEYGVDLKTVRCPEGLWLLDVDGLTAKTVNRLKGAGISYLHEVAAMTDEDLLSIPRITDKVLNILRAAITRETAHSFRGGRGLASSNLLIVSTSIGLSVRTVNCLESAGITYLHEAAAMSDGDLLAIANFGETSLRNLRDVARENGVGMLPSDDAPQDPAKLKVSTSIGLSIRTVNCLERAGITYLHEAAAMSDEDLLLITNFGETSLRNLRDVVNRYGVDSVLSEDKPQDPTKLLVSTGIGLSIRTVNCLKGAGITYLHEAAAMSDEELMSITNFGVTSLRNLHAVLKRHAFILRS